MKIENALRLARKVGKVEIRWDRLIVKTYEISLPNGNGVIFRGRDGLLLSWSLWTKTEQGRHIIGNCTTFARSLALVAFVQHDLEYGERKVTIENLLDPHRGLSRRVVVSIDGCEVCGGGQYLVGLADKAVETKCVGPLIDWVEEHALAHRPELNEILL